MVEQYLFVQLQLNFKKVAKMQNSFLYSQSLLIKQEFVKTQSIILV